MLEKVMIRNVIRNILMKAIVMVLWGTSIACIITNTSLWVPVVILAISIIVMGYSIYEDVAVMRIDMELSEDNNR